MAHTVYRIQPVQDGFCIEQSGHRSIVYATREAALEAAVGPASNSIKDGDDVTIEVRRSQAPDSGAN